MEVPVKQLIRLRCTWLICIILVYSTIVVFTHYKVVKNNRSSSLFYAQKSYSYHNEAIKTVHIVGKASISHYLWGHILKGKLGDQNNGFFQHGTHRVGDIQFLFLSGPGYIQTTLPQNISYLVLVLNGRTEEQVTKAEEWLNYLPHFVNLRRTALVLLGNERCENDWILTYLRSRGGLVDILFIVYDYSFVDNKEIFQWPLGVAIYRGFPDVALQAVDFKSKRHHRCNFVGTVYSNSSRKYLSNILKSNLSDHQCFVSTRSKWVAKETKYSLNTYINAVKNSDLTLHPVGKNTECYRLYEAISFGTVPVVEDVMTPGKCQGPLRLIKKYKAPLIFIQDWKELSDILKQESLLPYSEVILRRERIIKWYKDFKQEIGYHFLYVINTTFFK